MITISQSIVDQLLSLCRQASDEILSVYHSSSCELSLKSDDSPLTAADLAAHKVLVDGLATLYPEVPILSEESEAIPFSVRQQWTSYWLIDPLDGTKEFIDRNGEFTINVALIQNHQPVFGLIMIPVTGQYYWGSSGIGSYRSNANGGVEAMSTRSLTELADDNRISVMASRRHTSDKEVLFESRLRTHFDQVIYQQVGSSLKFCLIAEGLADCYPRLGPTCEWDTAAGQAIVEAAGGAVLNQQSQPLRYNTKDSLLNPDFYVVGDPKFPWINLIKFS